MGNTNERLQMCSDMLQRLLRRSERIEERLMEIEQIMGAMERPWLTVHEAAQYTGYSVNHFREIMRNEIPYFQRDRRQMVNRSDLDRWMEENTKEPAIY